MLVGDVTLPYGTNFFVHLPPYLGFRAPDAGEKKFNSRRVVLTIFPQSPLPLFGLKSRRPLPTRPKPRFDRSRRRS